MYCAAKADGIYSAGLRFVKQVDREAVLQLENSGTDNEERKRIASSVLT
jgi:hypothetical protein